ncbi:kinase-like protein [Patellaria atrata CBS 101060]|uniref:Kinase-like protein n=1 Tax=Patellaria atrata CBS 101060 TaxID=1346257 RepID=A0A9P4S391_9PEZI|nr:kinase-like protein [Patellaria atrata CBS 101060]
MAGNLEQPFPCDENVTFCESSFFKRPGAPLELPCPAEVRQIASQSTDPCSQLITRPPPVIFQPLGLLVKYGSEITLAEGQCLHLVHRQLSGRVPVPEVYGWCKDGEQTFIYMELVEGITLEASWENLAEEERKALCGQLRQMISAWRSLKQHFSQPFIGHVGRQPLLDVIFTSSCSPTAGPFKSTSEFHDWFSTAYGPYAHVKVERSPHPYRSFLPDGVPIVFTHADLHPSNILISRDPDPQIISIIDWHQSGWYPDYWEYCKARWTSKIGSEWETKYLPLFVDRYDFYDYWDYFVLARGV